MEWLSRLLVCALAVAGISVALVSGCRMSAKLVPDGGSCAQEQLGPRIPAVIADDAEIPVIRLELTAVLATVALGVSGMENVFPAAERNCSRGSPRLAFLAMRD